MAAVSSTPAVELQPFAEAAPTPSRDQKETPCAVAAAVPTVVANTVTIQKSSADSKVGVGLRSGAVVVTVRGAAEAAGLRPGDKIVSIDGVPVAHERDAAAKLAAAPAREVVVTIEPGPDPPPGAPPGGTFVQQHYCGPKAWRSCCIWGCVAEDDVREVYLAPDGRRFLKSGKEIK
mmetsp:Transcript_25333/g.78124  ORF Transcript_25333/g.78124 Transcript_25333/m.78124 type:complete len:176 (+) Transcript_25333:267-794(+)